MSKEYVIYGRPNCGYCEQAKKLLDLKGLPYTYMDADSSLFFRDTFTVNGIRKVPQVFVEGTKGTEERHIGGYEELLKELL